MQDPADVIEVSIPSYQWEEGVRFYTQLFGEPQQDGDSALQFPVAEDDLTLRITRDDTKELTNLPRPRFYPITNPNGRQRLIALFDQIRRGDKTAIVIQEPKEVGPGGRGCLIALISTGGTDKLLESQLHCLVHNPNW
jgi:hypothetical protein